MHALAKEDAARIRELLAESARLTQELEAARRDAVMMAPAYRFAGLILEEWGDEFGADLDGATIQEWAETCGLLTKVNMVSEDAPEPCTNCPGDCDVCYRFNKHAYHAVRFALAARGEDK